jgi:phosphoadenosine phosphosulfate reductase
MAMRAVSIEEENPINSDVLRLIGSGEAERWSAPEILSWAVENFAPRLVLSCSFGAREGMVLLDMMQRIDPASRVFTLDTGRLPQETYDLMDRVRDRYDKQIEVVFPRAADVEAMVREKGLSRYLADVDAWVSGLRRDQNVTRADTPKVEIDETNGGIVKLNPIADWTEDQVTAYVREHNVPVNRLHGEGYPSVGCAPCSRAIAPGDDSRAGRWWWENPETRECGIHVEEEDQGSGI